MRVVPGRKKVGDPIRRGGYSIREKVGEGGGGEGGGRPERPPLKQCGARRNGAREAVAGGAWERVAARPLVASPPRTPSPHLSSAMGDIGTRMDVGEKGRVKRLRRGGFRGVGCSRRRRKKSRRGSRRLAASAYTSQSIGTRHRSSRTHSASTASSVPRSSPSTSMDRAASSSSSSSSALSLSASQDAPMSKGRKVSGARPPASGCSKIRSRRTKAMSCCVEVRSRASMVRDLTTPSNPPIVSKLLGLQLFCCIGIPPSGALSLGPASSKESSRV
mmetsp:Transcript_45407/g.125907  ORF Transcript_45407/g.125907 Transcript_45407/m.125907 type:complete len:275 (+) Transcript_45407:184-1008(+)